MSPRPQRLIEKFLVTIFVLNCFSGFSPSLTTARAQERRVIVVNAEQPNLWTLEQAHYLLAQMHRRNLDLKAKSLEELDANEIAGLRFDVMRMLVEFGATFNQADLATNRLLSRNQEFNDGRREQLAGDRARLSNESVSLSGQIKDLEIEKADTEDADQKKRLDAKIAALTTHQTKVDKEIESTDAELKTLNAPSGQLKATEGGGAFDANKLPTSTFDKAFEDAAAKQIEKFNQAPKINASLQLDNFLQMQYEIISKQLSLLRDELGPGERLLFLELPQTVNAAHHESERKWAQSWWRIAGYTHRVLRPADAAAAVAVPAPTPRLDASQRPVTTEQDVRSIIEGQPIPVMREPPQSTTAPASRMQQVNYYDEFIDLSKYDGEPDGLKANTELKGKLKDAKFENRVVRTVELIPRQGSINVNDMKLRVKAGAFNFVLSTLFGFGSRLNIQRQREQFSQFVQQELYSSAFGKGSREFGWTFTPMPGADRLMSGVRTTYAVVVVPDDATALVLEANGCYFPRSFYPPNDFGDTKSPRWNDDGRTSRNCDGAVSKAFVVPIPSGEVNGGNEFWVNKIRFRPAPKGRRVVVEIGGKNFSSQTGVLIDGSPLFQSIGLAQPLIRDDSAAGHAASGELQSAEIQGQIERVDPEKIIFWFKMPPDYKGTPTITLIAPGRATDINWLPHVEVNSDGHDTTLDAYPMKMIGNEKAPDAFRIDGVRVFRGQTSGRLTAVVTGAGFINTTHTPSATSDTVAQVLVNGAAVGVRSFESPTLMTLDFPPTADETIKVTMVSTNPDPKKVETVESDAVANPARLSVTGVEFVTYEAAADEEPAVLVVKVTGTGFTDKLKASIGTKTLDVAVKAANEALLTITDPKAVATVTLEDGDTKQTVKTVVVRKTKP
jgi:hypothetical protein